MNLPLAWASPVAGAVRRVPLTPSGWTVLAGAAAAWAGGTLLGYRSLMALASAGAVALLLGGAVVLLRPRVTVARTIEPARVTVGEPALGRLVTRNIGRWPTPGFVAVDRFGDRPLPVRVPPVGAGAERTLHYPVPTPKRGRVPVGPVTVERRDPLGLARRAQRHGSVGTLWVHPRVHPLRPLPVGVVLDYEGRLSENAPKGTVTFSSLREYVPGDDPRQIHWRSTARTGALMVREHVDNSEPTTAVLLDTRAGVLNPDLFEHAVEVAASVTTACERHGHPATLHVLGEDVAEIREAGGHGLMDRLAAATATDEPDPVRLLDQAELIPAGGALVVVTGEEPATLARLTAQRRRFTPVVIVVLRSSGEPARTSRRSGVAVLHADTAVQATETWNQMIGGRRV